MIYHQQSNQAGFTIAELLVVIATSAIFTASIMTFTISYFQYGYRLQGSQSTLTSRLNAGDVLRESIGTSTGLIIQNGLADTNTNNPDPANATNQYWLPIHAVPGTITTGSSGVTKPLMYFRRPSLTPSGNYIMNGTQPYEDEYVLFLDGTSQSLLLRTIANPSAAGNRQRTSCPAALASMSCPADKIISTDLTSVSVRYFSRTGNLIDHNSITDPVSGAYIGPDFPAVEVVEFNLNLTRKLQYQKISTPNQSTVIRIALRNA